MWGWVAPSVAPSAAVGYRPLSSSSKEKPTPIGHVDASSDHRGPGSLIPGSHKNSQKRLDP